MKKTLILSASMLLLMACSEPANQEVSEPDTSSKAGTQETTGAAANLAEMKEPKTASQPPVKKFDWDWEAPTKPYYALGMQPIDDAGLYSRFSISAKPGVTVFTTNKGSFLLLESEQNKYYSHSQTGADGAVVAGDIASIVNIRSTFIDKMDTQCRALTAGMVDAFIEGELDLVLRYLEKTEAGEDLQTWVFQDIDDNQYYFSRRDIKKPKGYTYRCDDAFISSIEDGLKSARSLSF